MASIGPVRLPALPPAVPWVLGFVGVGLVYSAVRNESPLSAVRAVITGSGERKPLTGGGSTPDGAVSEPSADTAPPALVSVSNPPGYTPTSFKLRADAAAAFRAWTLAFGAPIPCTGGWRSAEAQRDGQQRNPGKFGSVEGSYHVKGLAVDVDNNWLNRLPIEGQRRLRQAAKFTGWGQARWKKGEAGCGKAASGAETDNDEPWHFSFGGCG
jgi:hypothetical protein